MAGCGVVTRIHGAKPSRGSHGILKPFSLRMHPFWFSIGFLIFCSIGLVGLTGYLYWRMRQHLRACASRTDTAAKIKVAGSDSN